ncbi:hypothetical protein AN641_03170, partial [Candidatus Epulonipiscioides gigas]
INEVANGNFKSKVKVTSKLRYFNTMATSFNKMLDELNSNEILKVDFINNFSHEFKTPINSIQGFAKHMKNSDLSDEMRNEYIDIIICESQRLTALANNVLNLSKVEHQAILNNKVNFNISEQIREVIILLYEKCIEKNIEIIFDAEELFYIGDKELIKQVWINLLDNALKFCYENTPIQIKISEKQNKLHISFSNYGDILSEMDRKHIFDKFYLSNSTGNGLGLTIAKKIIMLHKGNIYLSDKHKDKIIFEIFLPIKP